jgi:hypothetical protein
VEPNAVVFRHIKCQGYVSVPRHGLVGDSKMKRLAIALILTAAVPAVVTASTNLVEEFTGKSEVVAGSAPAFDDDRLISSKSSRPRSQRPTGSIEQPLDSKLTADWL